MSDESINRILCETMEAIINNLSDEYLLVGIMIILNVSAVKTADYMNIHSMNIINYVIVLKIQPQ